MTYTMKLEGARGGYFQTIMIMGIEDPEVLANLDAFHETLQRGLVKRIEATFDTKAVLFDVSLRFYGWNGPSWRLVPVGTALPLDVGVMLLVRAPINEWAIEVGVSGNPPVYSCPVD